MPNTLAQFIILALYSEFENKLVFGVSWKHSADPKHEGWGGFCSTGRFQSPINILYKNVWRKKVEPMVFINYNNVTTTVCNNGHSVMFKVDQKCESGIAAGGLRGLYFLDEVQFHWGSEHTIQEKRFPLEMHLIHYNSIYNNKKAAMCFSDGLAIVAVLFCMSENSNSVLNPIISALEDELIYNTIGNMSIVPDSIDFGKLLPFDSQKYFRYHGSLTTPPCTEIVTWTVMEKVSPLSKFQLQRFCKIITKTGNKTNFRWQKPLNNRKLYLLTGGTYRNDSSFVMLLFVCFILFMAV